MRRLPFIACQAESQVDRSLTCCRPASVFSCAQGHHSAPPAGTVEACWATTTFVVPAASRVSASPYSFSRSYGGSRKTMSAGRCARYCNARPCSTSARLAIPRVVKFFTNYSDCRTRSLDEYHSPRIPTQCFNPDCARPRIGVKKHAILNLWSENVEQRLAQAIRRRTSIQTRKGFQHSAAKLTRDDTHVHPTCTNPYRRCQCV